MGESCDLGVKLDSRLGLLLGDPELDLLVVADVGDLDSLAERLEQAVLDLVHLFRDRRDFALDRLERSLLL